MKIDSGIVYDSLVHEAYSRLWPKRIFDYNVREEYNRRLGSFNANISLRGKDLSVKYNLQWKNVDREIQIGLIQNLLIKIIAKNSHDKKLSTFNLKLYNNFCKQIPTYLIEEHDLESNCENLRESFARVNQKFFDNGLTECSLKWGNTAVRRLASYNFNNDSITVSSIFKDASEEIIDLLMYHEMLHKELKFDCRNGRVHTHTPEFKRRENLYPNKVVVEKEIDVVIRAVRYKKVSRVGSRVGKRQGNPIIKKIQDFFGR